MIKQLIAMGILTGLLGGSIAAPASAAAQKRAKPRTITTTLYAHGPSALGEIDVAGSHLPEPCSADLPLTLTSALPDATIDRSMALRPISKDGQALVSPLFQGALSGTIKGGITLTARVLAALPANVEARLWIDTECPAASKATARAAVVIPAGQTDASIVFKGLELKVKSSIAIEIASTPVNRSVGRLLYDSVDALTRIEFQCIPLKGKKCA